MKKCLLICAKRSPRKPAQKKKSASEKEDEDEKQDSAAPSTRETSPQRGFIFMHFYAGRKL